MIIIAAMSEDRIIGSGDGMPWDVPEEYEQYIQFVTGQTVIMGRRTYEIFGSDLSPDTTVVVISRTAKFSGVHVVNSFDAANEFASSTGKVVFVAGGASVYERAIPSADEMLLSTIKGTFDGDTYFPEFDRREWNIVSQRNELKYVFRHFKRRPAS